MIISDVKGGVPCKSSRRYRVKLCCVTIASIRTGLSSVRVVTATRLYDLVKVAILPTTMAKTVTTASFVRGPAHSRVCPVNTCHKHKESVMCRHDDVCGYCGVSIKTQKIVYRPEKGTYPEPRKECCSVPCATALRTRQQDRHRPTLTDIGGCNGQLLLWPDTRQATFAV